MKILFTALVPMVMALTQVGNATPGKPGSEEVTRQGTSTAGGRFQLFQGLYVINAKGAAFNESGVFKIDSSTGRVWKYEEGETQDGKYFQRWTPIEQTP